MLSLVNSLTFNSGLAHEQMYSLSVDGTGDYLETGDAFQSTYRGSFSYSFWAKPADGQPSGSEVFLGSQNSSAEDNFNIALATDGTVVANHKANNDGASYATNAAVYADGAGDWKHICVTVTDGDTGNSSYIIYIDGAAVAGTLSSAVAGTAHDDWTSTTTTWIGAMNNNGSIANAFAGQMDEVALFNVVLDADAVAAIYNSGKPLDLTLNRGNYDNSSALVGYWRMFNGSFDDKVNGIVHDQTNPGFGSELIVNGIMEVDDNWSAYGSPSAETQSQSQKYSGNSSWSFTVDATNEGIYQNLASSVVANNTYLVSFWVYPDDATTMSIEFNDATATITTGLTGLTQDDWNHVVRLFTPANSGTGQVRFTGGSATSGTWFIDDVSIKKINGNPGIANADATHSTDTPDD
jgi:hypothetical protein